jgi:phage-related protein
MIMLANNINIKDFGAELFNLDIQNAELDTTKDWLIRLYIPTILRQKFTYKKITTEIYVEGTSREDVLTKISNLKNIFKKATLQFDDMSFLYDATLDSDVIERFSKSNKMTMTCIFSGYAYKAVITETMNHVSNKTINVLGNLATDAIITVTVPIDTISLTLTGIGEDPIKINNLKANISVIINGEDGTVLQSGVNKFSDCDIWEFPSLQPGSNTIGVSTSNCIVQIQYKPRWI